MGQLLCPSSSKVKKLSQWRRDGVPVPQYLVLLILSWLRKQFWAVLDELIC